jgi:hypothetical protein
MRRPIALPAGPRPPRPAHAVWADAEEVRIGEAIPRRVEQAVEQADYLVVVLSPHGVSSAWCEREWRAKFWEEAATGRTCLLPALLEGCRVPLFLRPKCHADSRTEYAIGFAQLAIVLHEPAGMTAPGGARGVLFARTGADLRRCGRRQRLWSRRFAILTTL